MKEDMLEDRNYTEQEDGKMELLFVTSNPGKIKSAQACIDKMGLPIVIKQHVMQLTEVQAEDVEEISQAKAREAFAKVGKPLIVEDGGFCVSALNGFPGVYAKYILGTIGAEGIISLMNGQKNRACEFVAVTTFADASGNLTSFRGTGGNGLVATTKDPVKNPRAWSDIWNIYIPDGHQKTLSSFTEEEEKAHYTGEDKTKKGSISLFVDWLADNLHCL